MIRTITSEDIQTLTTIYNHYIKNTIVSFEEETVSVDEMSRRVKQTLFLNYPWLVAEQNEQVIGFAYANKWHERSAYKHTVIVTVYLLPEYTGKGWGFKLYKKLFDQLKSCGVNAVIAGISLPNQASIALHEKMGLKKVAHFHEVGFKFNQWIDVAYWQLNLKE